MCAAGASCSPNPRDPSFRAWPNPCSRSNEAYALSIQFDRKQGYFIQGNEKDIRAALSRFLFEQLLYADWNPSSPTIDGLIHADLFRRHFSAFREEELASVYRIIVSTEQRIGMEWTDETIMHLTLRIWLSANRMKQGHTVQLDEEEKAALRETLQFKAAMQIAEELGELFGRGPARLASPRSSIRRANCLGMSAGSIYTRPSTWPSIIML